MNLAQITTIPRGGDKTVSVSCSEPNGTLILVFVNNVLQGTGTLSGSVVTIALSSPLVQGDCIQAFVTEQGNQGGNVLQVLQAQGNYSGWLSPTTVDGVAYNEYLQDGGTPIAEYYAPETTGNTAREQNYELLDELFGIAYDLNIQYAAGQAIVTVINAEYVGNGALIKFDNDVTSSTNSKIYTANGTYSVTVYNDTLQKSKTTSYTLSIPASTVSVNSWSHGYLLQLPNGTFPVFATSTPNVVMGYRIVGIHATVQSLPIRYVYTNYQQNETQYFNLPQGNYTLKFFEFQTGAWVEVASMPLIYQLT